MSLGSSTIKDFTWKQLLDSVSVLNARCSTVCPATTQVKHYQMKIITDIRSQLYAETIGLGKSVI